MASRAGSADRDRPEPIVLEAIGAEHAPRVQELASDPAIGATSNVPSPYPEDGAESFISDSLERRARGDSFVFAILAGGELVGLCGLERRGEERVAELGYWVGRPFWGRGYAGAAARRLVEWGFSNLRLERVEACCLERNLASRRVLERAGFRLRRRGTNPDCKWGADEPLLYFELERQGRGDPR